MSVEYDFHVNVEVVLPKKVVLPTINEQHVRWKQTKHDFHVNVEAVLPKKVVSTDIS